MTKGNIGILSLGRIGKYLTWILAKEKMQNELVVCTGRKTGTTLSDFAEYLEYDSNLGDISRFFYGYQSKKIIEIKEDAVWLNGVKIIWLNDTAYRDPAKIPWKEYGVNLVADTSGKFLDPSVEEGTGVRGHLKNADKVVVSAPFKAKAGQVQTDDSITIVGGVNNQQYDPAKHCLISNASCTTNCVAPIIKALVDTFGDRMLSYSLTTVHAATNSQYLVDNLPKDGATDRRKSRSAIATIIPSTTGAAKAIMEVIPELQKLGIGSLADALRVETRTGSISNIVVSFIGDYRRDEINNALRNYAFQYPEVLKYSEQHIISQDIVGSTHNAIINGDLTHTRTAIRQGDAYTMTSISAWYDNEFGYAYTMFRLLKMIQEME